MDSNAIQFIKINNFDTKIIKLVGTIKNEWLGKILFTKLQQILNLEWEMGYFKIWHI